MSAIPQPTYGLDKLYLFPYYGTREEYQKATGVEPPPFTPTRPPKFWEDPAAKTTQKRTVVYNQVLAMDDNGQPLATPEGNPYTDELVLYKEDAAVVNIPPQGANIVGADVPPIPLPLRALEAEEELFFGLGGYVAVRNKVLVAERDVSFAMQDRKLLQAIAAKLGIPA